MPGLQNVKQCMFDGWQGVSKGRSTYQQGVDFRKGLRVKTICQINLLRVWVDFEGYGSCALELFNEYLESPSLAQFPDHEAC